jgi:hypothetical protein
LDEWGSCTTRFAGTHLQVVGHQHKPLKCLIFIAFRSGFFTAAAGKAVLFSGRRVSPRRMARRDVAQKSDAYLAL